MPKEKFPRPHIPEYPPPDDLVGLTPIFLSLSQSPQTYRELSYSSVQAELARHYSSGDLNSTVHFHDPQSKEISFGDTEATIGRLRSPGYYLQIYIPIARSPMFKLLNPTHKDTPKELREESLAQEAEDQFFEAHYVLVLHLIPLENADKLQGSLDSLVIHLYEGSDVGGGNERFVPVTQLNLPGDLKETENAVYFEAHWINKKSGRFYVLSNIDEDPIGENQTHDYWQRLSETIDYNGEKYAIFGKIPKQDDDYNPETFELPDPSEEVTPPINERVIVRK